MDFEQALQSMERNSGHARQLCEGVLDDQARWKPEPDSWSILEVINHLYDEEREDFRVRLDIILHDPERPWPGIDPAGWVQARGYNRRELNASLQNWLDERQRSLAWLRELEPVDWNQSGRAPWGGEISAGDMLSAWVAHDVLHLRQLVELHWAYLTSQVLSPFNPQYAGDW